jgi:uncharacterized protein (TIGR02284 family)
MEQMREYTIKILNDLIDACRDEYILFNAASEKIKNETLKEAFLKYSQEKQEHIIKLECEVKRLGGDLNESKNKSKVGTYILNIKQETDTKKLLRECVRSDAFAISLYSSAIKEDILWEVIPLVAKQYFGSKNIHDQIYNIFNKASETQTAAQIPVN